MFCHEKDAQNVLTGWFTTKIYQNVITQKKLFIMTMKSLLEVQNTNKCTVNLDVNNYNPVWLSAI